ncbi:MAG TPA: mechanosensitive ion channel domain-containing protein [Pyrinomonadaceae bacterium]|nr:mechanosensitive ion channel domain-containing protein [Pyrinomonadaceae bacterium]
MHDEERQAEKLKREDPDIARELEKTAAPPVDEVVATPVHTSGTLGKLSLYALLILAATILYYMLRWEAFGFLGVYEPLAERAALGAITILFVLVLLTAVRAYLISRVADAAARYNLNRIAKLIAGILIFVIALSVLFANWYTAVVSLGLISLVLGFALQTPITSFIGWIYILVKTPYRVGDRIKIDDATGDVLDVAYLDTTLWEFGGPLLSTQHHPSGRVIKFPNAKVLTSTVYNSSWSLFPYIWNDVKVQVAYQSDLEFVAKVMTEAAEEEVGEAMMERVTVYRELLSQTAINSLEVKERPSVVFRVNNNTWIDAIVRYLVEPRRAGTVKTNLTKKILARLNEQPDKVMFPKADTR